jgi:PAS domain S-box-containing protein
MAGARMTSFSHLLKLQGAGRLGRKLLIRILLGIVFFTALGAMVQLTIDFRKDLQVLDAQLAQIHTSRVSSLTSSLWHLDENQVLSQLEGILDLRDIKYARVVTPDGLEFFRGEQAEEKDLMIREFPLLYKAFDRIEEIGTLVVAGDRSAVLGRIKDKILVIVVTQGVQFLLVAVLIVAIVHMLVTRHLRRMALYTSELNIDRLQEPLVLDKASAAPDEIDIVVSAFNAMRENLLRDIRQKEEAEAKLKAAEGYIRNILDSMPSVLIAVDENGRVTQWNQQAARTTGVLAGDAMGRLFADVYPDAPWGMARIMAAVTGKVPVKEAKVPRKVGEMTGYVDVTVYPLEADSAAGAVVRIDDVSERVRLEEMMIQSEKMVSIGGLAAGMAHEINNPLAGILQNAQVVRNRVSPEMPANMKVAEEVGIDLELLHAYFERRGCLRMMDSIMESGQRAARIVENMLSFSRKGNVEMAKVDICALLDRTVELAANDYDLKKQYDFRRIRIVREYEADLPFVPCAESKIQQVFFNLIRNGAQAMASKQGEACFVLRVRSLGESVCIEVEDNGPGMSEELRKRVFEPFFTTKKVGEGTGLGLSVSYFIVVENHGGQMEVESVPGQGTKFVVILPLTPDAKKAEGGQS